MTANVAASVKARLLAQARMSGEEFERTLVRYAAERLLYRLGESPAAERCVLKGVSLLAAWIPDPHRATRDIDLLARGSTDEEAVRRLVEVVCAVECPEDAVDFDVEHMTIDPIRIEEKYKGRRVRFNAYLGKARIVVQLDIGTGDTPGVEEEVVGFPSMLPQLPRPRVRAYPREASIAEKFEAAISLGTRNSRMKDFHDLWALSEAFAFDGERLRRAVTSCLERRETSWRQPPVALRMTFYESEDLDARWRSYLESGSILMPPPRRFADVGEKLIRFLGPIHESMLADLPFTKKWVAGGPWQST